MFVAVGEAPVGPLVWGTRSGPSGSAGALPSRRGIPIGPPPRSGAHLDSRVDRGGEGVGELPLMLGRTHSVAISPLPSLVAAKAFAIVKAIAACGRLSHSRR